MRTTALVQYYGSNRTHANRVGELLKGCSWVGIPFAGGMCEIAHIEARTIVANDLHKSLIELAEVVQSSCRDLQRALRQTLFHPVALQRARDTYLSAPSKFDRAAAFFTLCWLTRGGTAGTESEQTAGLSIRWNAAGGDSVKRWHSAIDSLESWAEEFKRCTFTCMDAFDFLKKCKDQDGHGVYCDPPFFGLPGKRYLYNVGFTEDEQLTWHEQLAESLCGFQQTRVVVRAYDEEVVRDLYDSSSWEYITFEGRKQTNAIAPELLLVRN